MHTASLVVVFDRSYLVENNIVSMRQDQLHRIDTAIDVWNSIGYVNKSFLCLGGGCEGPITVCHARSIASHLEDSLAKKGTHATIAIETFSRDTISNILSIRMFLERYSWYRDLYFVSSAYHQIRIKAISARLFDDFANRCNIRVSFVSSPDPTDECMDTIERGEKTSLKLFLQTFDDIPFNSRLEHLTDILCRRHLLFLGNRYELLGSSIFTLSE